MTPSFSIDFRETTSMFLTLTTFFLISGQKCELRFMFSMDRTHEEHFGENIVWFEAFVIGFALVPWQCWKIDNHYHYNYDVMCDTINATNLLRFKSV